MVQRPRRPAFLGLSIQFANSLYLIWRLRTSWTQPSDASIIMLLCAEALQITVDGAYDALSAQSLSSGVHDHGLNTTPAVSFS